MSGRMMDAANREAVRECWRSDDGSDLVERLERAAYAMWFLPGTEFESVVTLRALLLGAAETLEVERVREAERTQE